ncbi:MAG TPA: M56 family metallopeptidase, partial [Gemmatimonadaceae bacterium]|nr:M56 family metallopeptidase [Gemmatimonadaceae bacterium]
MTTAVIEPVFAAINRLDFAIVERTTIVLVVGLTALVFARRARASVRHLLMAATFGTVLVLPLAMSTVPALTVRLPVSAGHTFGGLVSNPAPDVPVAAISVSLRHDTNSVRRSLPSIANVFRFVWAAGATLLLVILLVDVLRLRALKRRGLPWLGKKDLMRSLGIASGAPRSVEVLLHESIDAPLTCGLWRPAILLPIDANDWPDDDLRRALVHELEHVHRGDWATQLVARVVCACYWFHPLVWMAWRRLRLEGESACDDAVVECAESSQYA